MPLIEPPEPTSTIEHSGTIGSSTGAPSLSQSIFPPESLHLIFSGLTLTVYQDPTDLTTEDLEGGPMRRVEVCRVRHLALATHTTSTGRTIWTLDEGIAHETLVV